MTSPSPAQIRQARIAAGLSQAEAARTVWAGPRTWQRYESEGPDGRAMHRALWELFCLKTGQPHLF
jgi:putative transcriptional regulator